MFESLEEIRCEMDQICDRAEAIYEKARNEDRDLNASELSELKAIQGHDGSGGRLSALAQQLQARRAIDIRSAAKLQSKLDSGELRTPDDIAAGIKAGGRSQGQWQTDGNGNRFAMLAKGDKATDFFKPEAENEFGHFVAAKLFGTSRVTPDSIRAALKEGDNSLGGFLVPNKMMGEVIDLARAKSVLVPAGMRTIMMDSESLRIPRLESEVTVANKAELATIPLSDMTFGSRLLMTRTAAARTKVSRELWEDAPNLLAEQIGSWLGMTMATQIDSWGIAGTGVAQPNGILTMPDISKTDSVGAIAWGDVSGAATAIRVRNHEPRSVILHPTIYADLFESTTGDGTNSASNWLDRPPTLKDVDFYQSTNCPLAKLVVGDFSKFVMGLRTGARVEASTVAGDAFETHSVQVKVTMRYDFTTFDDTAFEILEGITS